MVKNDIHTNVLKTTVVFFKMILNCVLFSFSFDILPVINRMQSKLLHKLVKIAAADLYLIAGLGSKERSL